MHGLHQPFRRWHQLSGTQSKNPIWTPGGVLQFKMDDLPVVMMIANRPYACKIAGIELRFAGTLENKSLTNDLQLFFEDMTPSLINDVQLDGTAMGTPISSNNYLGGILDVNEYIACGLRFMSAKQIGAIFTKGSAPGVFNPEYIDHGVFLPLGNACQQEGHHTFPLTCLINEGLLTINCARQTFSNNTDPTQPPLSDPLCTLQPDDQKPINSLRVTASALVYPADEIVISPGYTLTRFKSTAQSGPDTISLNSFGTNSGFVGVQKRAGIMALLWASARLRGPAAGSGATGSITDYSNDYFGVRQTNDIQAIKNDLYTEMAGDTGGIEAVAGVFIPGFGEELRAPFFDTNAALDPWNNANPPPNFSGSPANFKANPMFYPIVPPVRHTKVTKLVEAQGNPSYNMTGVFTADHYTYLWGVYAWTPEKGQALIQRIKDSGVGMALYKSNDLAPVLKNSKKQDPQEINYSKRRYMPNKLLPVGMIDTPTVVTPAASAAAPAAK